MDKSINKILTKLYSYFPLSNKKGLNIDPIYLQIFEFLPYVYFFKGFSIQNFQRFSLFSNRSNSVNI